MESEESSSNYMCEPVPHYPWRAPVELTPSQSSRSSSKFVVVLDFGGAEPSNPMVTVMSSDSNSREKVLDDPYYPGTLSDNH